MAKKLNDKDFDLGLDNAQLDDGIQEANAYEVGKSLNETLKATNQRIENLVWNIAVTERTMDELRMEAQTTSADWTRQVNNWRTELKQLLSVVLTPVQKTEYIHPPKTAISVHF
ncbi:MAG: hypothetical protein LIP02_07910, partial [Bacteroidales bacterium]|nr:hypothetical protein [Bacteroidales bacterium]